MTNIQTHLTFLYGADKTLHLLDRVKNIVAGYRPRIHAGDAALSERDAILITYGDQLQAPGEKPLQTLSRFCKQELTNVVSGIHILPFYPWTSDDGFSVADYREVDPAVGTWDDISSLRGDFKLMFDAVINHISAESDWFKAFLRDDARFRDYFIVVTDSPDLSRVVRPRALPLLTTFSTSAGEKRVWTTFSSDQIDLNYQNPEVLLEILEILLMYVKRGATFLRLDAIAYLWKEFGTACIHLPHSHHIIQFLRAVLDEIAPHVQLITETNVPHADNISYFGDGTNEAQLVYNFALPPLTLHTFYTEDARVLSEWAATLCLPSDRTTFFNFLASHDGIGLNPVRGILSLAEIDGLVQKTLAHGGLISYKDGPDGTQSPYEMNINYFDALSDPQGDEPVELQVDRFIAAQAMMLSLMGVPAVYFHSLLGSRGWPDGVKQTGRFRTINREKCELASVQLELADPLSLRSIVFKRYSQLLSSRRTSSAFHPRGGQKVMDLHPSVFALERLSPDENSRVTCLHNVSARTIDLHLAFDPASDLITGRIVAGRSLSLGPYQILWVKQ